MQPREPTEEPKRPKRWRRSARWFLAEFAVVVSGVLVALALNAWWSSRQDAALAHVYLEQLYADLQATERLIHRSEKEMRVADRAGGQLVRAFQRPTPPPRDSLLTWIQHAFRYRYPAPVIGTAEALVSTGDLTLIEKNSLRAGVINYLRESQTLHDDFKSEAAAWKEARDALSAFVDYQEVLVGTMPQAIIDSLAQRYYDFPVPAGERRGRFPFDPAQFLNNRQAYDALVALARAKTNMRWDREVLLKETQALMAQVADAL